MSGILLSRHMTKNLALKPSQLATAVSSALSDFGFERRGLFWHRSTQELFQVISLQKSAWGPQYYINLGVSIREVDDSLPRVISKCHTLGRLAMFLPGRDPAEFVLDLDCPVTAEKTIQILSALRMVCRTFFDECQSVGKLRAFLRKHPHLPVAAEAKEFLRD